MNVHSRRVDSDFERQLITGMITSDEVLREVEHLYRPELIKVPFVRTVAQWCLQYWEKYQKAPRKDIQNIFNHHVTTNKLPPDQAEAIEAYLGQLSSDWKHNETQFNAQYLLDKAEDWFKAQAMQVIMDNAQVKLIEGDVQGAHECLIRPSLPERVKTKGIDPLMDESALETAFDVDGDTLFTMPGELGTFLGPISRGDFISIMAPEKRGKSFWLMEIAERARWARCNVVRFVVGDMSEAQTLRRDISYHTRKTFDRRKVGKEVLYPVMDCFHNQIDDCDLDERVNPEGEAVLQQEGGEGWVKSSIKESPDHVPCTYCKKNDRYKYRGAVWHKLITLEGVTESDVRKHRERMSPRLSGIKYKLVVVSSASPGSILTQLDIWEAEEGFVPDLIVLDFVDKLSPDHGGDRDFRHQEDSKWAALRILALDRYCAVITATQSDAQSYKSTQVREQNFTEHKGKYAHVTAIWTLNQTPAEKRDKVIRIGRMFVREDDYDVNKTCMVLECRDIGRPYLNSYRT